MLVTSPRLLYVHASMLVGEVPNTSDELEEEMTLSHEVALAFAFMLEEPLSTLPISWSRSFQKYLWLIGLEKMKKATICGLVLEIILEY